jgi:hypothetical protein
MADESTDVGADEQVIEEGDPFEGCEPIPGHEELGRVIRDKHGNLSGSPGNYEATRGASSEDVTGTPLSEEEEAELLAFMETQIPKTI